MTQAPPRGFRLFSPGSWSEARRVVDILRAETVGGALLLAGALLGMFWANSPWSEAYEGLRAVKIGPAALHLDLSLAAWAADGLLAVFFFVAGLELKREFVAGDLRDPRRAAIPIAAAVAGVLVPAAVYLLITSGAEAEAAKGWAVPTATDIAFALAVLAVIGRHLPAALRTFLLTLAVVDDVLAIVIIALFYTEHLAPLPLLAASAPLAVFAFLVQRGVRSWWLLLPLAVLAWGLVHASGVHATVAGVLLAFTVPVAVGRRPGPGLAEHFEHRFRPLSAGVAVPVFAFLSAGVPLGGLDGLAEALTDPVALAVVAGLVIGKPVGVMAATWLMARFTRADLDENLAWVDVLGLSILAGIGFTVSLLIGELAFGIGSERDGLTKIAVLTGSLAAALLAAAILRLRNNAYRRIEQASLAEAEG
ncbi:sodium/proton antiporter (NhaA family) [Nonomuraea fuscirosea]|uniref:Na(+)/H(+) antiporter NhaA n=1 Tax=Nonomuraea fuscirosea TaxID=1291556 RepID=A0A2T0MQA1_9ACTN|nr:Na+/H+ antiporter NhaA [Nonomuraea fuscirosea]PRX60311.1 sodium/proton antiporter (NhaA family) [Nonomuraea fuscirosea]